MDVIPLGQNTALAAGGDIIKLGDFRLIGPCGGDKIAEGLSLGH